MICLNRNYVQRIQVIVGVKNRENLIYGEDFKEM